MKGLWNTDIGSQPWSLHTMPRTCPVRTDYVTFSLQIAFVPLYAFGRDVIIQIYPISTRNPNLNTLFLQISTGKLLAGYTLG